MTPSLRRLVAVVLLVLAVTSVASVGFSTWLAYKKWTEPATSNRGCQVELYDDGQWEPISYRKASDWPCPGDLSQWMIVFVHGDAASIKR